MSVVQVKSKSKDVHFGDNLLDENPTITDLHAQARKMQVENWMAIGKAKLKAMKSVDDADQYDAFDSEENKGDEDLEKQNRTQKANQDP